jgi:protein CpxP
MFRKIALSGLLLSFLSLPLLAQQTATPNAPAQANDRMGRNRSGQDRPMADPATRARKMTDRMTQELGLDQATSQKVYEATLARTQKVNDIQANTDNNKAKAQALKANADDYKSKLQGILTPDQFAKMGAMKGKGNRRGNRGGSDTDTNEKQNN